MAPKITIVDQNEPAIDRTVVDKLVRLAEEDDDPDFVPEIMTYFIETTPATLETLSRAITNGDTAALVDTAHMLKGASGNIGAKGMAEMCRIIEKNARSGNLDEATALFPEVNNEFRRAKAELENFLGDG